MTSLWVAPYSGAGARQWAPPNKEFAMLDLLYVAASVLFFALCWALTKACEKL
jgi:hypothetical protein